MPDILSHTAPAPAEGALSRRRFIEGVTAALSAVIVPAGAKAASASLTEPRLVPFRIDVPQSELDELKRRLDATRWPERETVEDGSQGPQLESARKLIDYWRTRYDWRRLEGRLNRYEQYKIEVDGLGIHVLHARSRHPNAMPLIMTHGWPGSIVEFLDAIDPLVNPTAHGGTANDAFHVVLPSIPGHGFSDKPAGKGWNKTRISWAWATIMQRLGYDRYVAQGGDWGSVITTEMARLKVPGLAAVHLNLPFVVPAQLPATLSADEQLTMAQIKRFASDGSGYFQIQASRPQTIGYLLADTPAGQATWIYEKLSAWSDSDGRAEQVLSFDQILDDVMMYWVTNSGASSARMYAEHADLTFTAVPLDLPVAVSVFPGEIFTPPKRWAEQAYGRLIYWNRVPRGGHFAAFEQPRLFVAELRKAFRTVRSS